MAFTDLDRRSRDSASSRFTSGWQTTIAGVFALFLITLPFVFTWVNEELFEVPKMLYTYAFAVVLLALWGIRMIHEKRFIFRRTCLDIPLLLFLISQVLSTIFSLHPQTSLLGYYSRLNGGLLSTLAYLAIYYVIVNNLSLKQLKKTLRWSIFASIIVSAYGILEHFGHSFSCLLITGKFGVSCWVQNVRERVFASFGQPNWLAAYTVTLLPLALTLLPQKDSKKTPQVLLVLANILLFTVLIFTGSRSGLIAAALGVFLVLTATIYIHFTSTNINKKSKPKSRAWRPYLPLALALAGMGGAALIFGTRYTPSLEQIFTQLRPKTAATIANTSDTNSNLNLAAGEEEAAAATPSASIQTQPFDGDISNDTGEIRRIVWRGAVEIWKRYPLLGSGVETFAYSYYLDRPMEHNAMFEWDFLYNKAHNEFLNYLATTGLLGLSTYLLIFCVFSIFVISYIIRPGLAAADKRLLAGLLAGLAGLAVSNFFGFSTVVCQVLQFTFFAFASLLIISVKDPTFSQDSCHLPPQQKTNYRQWQYAAICAILVATFFGLNRVGNYWYADFLYARGKSYIVRGQSTLGLQYIERATRVRPNEALYQNDLADFLSQLAVAYQGNGETEAAQLIKNQTLTYLDRVRSLNPVHLNFFKTRTRIYTALAAFDAEFLELARQNLVDTMALAPTDPKLVYNYATVLTALGDTEDSEAALRQALAMRPGYHEVRKALAVLEENRNNISAAQDHYRYILEHITPHDSQAIEALARLATASAMTTESTP